MLFFKNHSSEQICFEVASDSSLRKLVWFNSLFLDLVILVAHFGMADFCCLVVIPLTACDISHGPLCVTVHCSLADDVLLLLGILESHY